MDDVLITTTPSIEGYRITKYIGPIVIPTIGAANMMRDWIAGFTDFFGGKSKSYEGVYGKFLKQAVMTMMKQAKENGANAVVNMRIETTNLSSGKSVLSIFLYGTAVTIEKIKIKTDKDPEPGEVTDA